MKLKHPRITNQNIAVYSNCDVNYVRSTVTPTDPSLPAIFTVHEDRAIADTLHVIYLECEYKIDLSRVSREIDELVNLEEPVGIALGLFATHPPKCDGKDILFAYQERLSKLEFDGSEERVMSKWFDDMNKSRQHPCRTCVEVDKLKEEWLADPNWDIEHTPGFEAHVVELSEFHDSCRLKWDYEYLVKQVDEANGLGISVKLMNYLQSLERTVFQQSKEIESFQNPNR